MTLTEASAAARAAAEAGDLDALAQALETRAQAIAAGEAPTLETLEAGQRAVEALEAFKRRGMLESARLRQLAEGFLRDLAVVPEVGRLSGGSRFSVRG